MADEEVEAAEDAPKKKGKKKLIIILVGEMGMMKSRYRFCYAIECDDVSTGMVRSHCRFRQIPTHTRPMQKLI